MKASFKRHLLRFKIPGGTSRGVLTEKETFFLILREGEHTGIGECGILRKLSADDRPDFVSKLQWICEHIHLGFELLYNELKEFPAIQIGLESAFLSLRSKNEHLLFPSDFSAGKKGIEINGLVWMGDEAFMQQQISEKIKAGFHTIKMKVGAIDFDTELKLLKSIRSRFSSSEITIRVDANGAFKPGEAMEKLSALSELEIHSIEQPIKAGQWQEMAELCEKTPLPIALDEELIGVFEEEEKIKMIETIKPQYIILKPSLIGGFKASDFWISLINQHESGWWITSALESNIGLNAIAQYTFTKDILMPQGLGTGSLYTNNISSPLEVSHGYLYYNTDETWGTVESVSN